MSFEQSFDRLKKEFGAKILSLEVDRVGCPVITVTKDIVITILGFLKQGEDFDFLFLADLTAYDDLDQTDGSQGRFVVVYNLLSPARQARVRIKVRLKDGESVPTATPLWKAANWAEREVWDMYGIAFEGHPDLRRIMMDQRFEGHPQRKDYYWRKYQLFLDAEPIPEHLLKD